MKKSGRIKVRVCCMVLAVCLPLGAGQWSMFRGNQQRTGFYSGAVGHPEDSAAWTIRLSAPIISSPVVVDGVVYIGGRDSCLHALDARSGKLLWKRKTGNWVDATALVHNGMAIVGSRDGNVHVFDSKHGDPVMVFRAGLQLSSAVPAIGNVILCGLGYPLHGMAAYKIQSTPQWDNSREAEWIAPLPQLSYSSAALRGQAAVIGAADGKLYGIDASGGDTTWSIKTDGMFYLSTPAIDDTVVYFAPGEYDLNVYAAGLLSGQLLWRNSINRAPSLAKLGRNVTSASTLQQQQLLRHSPAQRNVLIERMKEGGIELPRVVVRTSGGLAKSGGGGGARHFIPSGCIKTSSVAVDGRNVYVVQKHLGYILSQDGEVDHAQRFILQALDKKTGVPAWHFEDYRRASKLGYCSSPAVTKHLVFAGWGEGKLYAFNADNGEMVWEQTLDGNIISSPAIADGKLYVATTKGSLYAFGLAKTAPGVSFAKSTYCYPNPARDRFAHIQVYVDKPAELNMVIYNQAERPVRRWRQPIAAGKSVFDWPVSGVANGVYFVRVMVTYDSGATERKILKLAVLR